MRSLTNALAAIPLRELGRRPDVVLALGVSFIVAMLIIPLPSVVLDALIAVNLAAALVVLLVALFARRALDVSTFPTLLLVTTLFRLGLNVSTTRGILSKGDGGEVVEAFGHFVLQGDVIVGAVIFLVITLVQFLVIAKGSERVAEVAARFTLDAMPGKQMSIDAALRSGAFDEKEAERRRKELARESQLFGNMDGAMKFVKGDAIAGLVITSINFVAGIAIGVLRGGLSAGDAVETYAILAVGDGLVSQIPALLVTLAAGLLVTRVASEDDRTSLGSALGSELGSNPRVLGVASVLMFALGLVPALPMLPFFALGTLAAIAAASKRLFPKEAPQTPAAVQEEAKAAVAKTVEQAKAQRAISDNLAPSVVPLGIDLDPVLSAALGFTGPSATSELVASLIPQLRDALYLETGVRFPGVRVRTDCGGLPRSTFVLRVDDVPVLQETFPADQFLAIASPESLRRLGIIARQTKSPFPGTPGSIVSAAQREVVEAAGVQTWSASGVIVLFLATVLRRRAKQFLGFQEVSELVERLEKAYPSLVKEVIPKIVTVPQLLEVLRRLVEEGVSIRNLRSIVQALGEHGMHDDDAVFLTEKVRAALATQIAHAHAGLEGRLPVLLLDPVIEDTIQGAITAVKGGKMLALEPSICREIIDEVIRAADPLLAEGLRPVVLTNAEVRRYVRKLLESSIPEVAVLSYEELPGELTVQPMGRVCLAA
ncbi:type III secretion system export apparatus subunit SctV [Myxococcota bacterium]|nr:type III secretion system export apparatus subunit SctV [Myxococcota bacterium]